mgnify:FL=1
MNKQGDSFQDLILSDKYIIENQLNTFYQQSISMVSGWSILGYPKTFSGSIVPIFRSENTAFSDSTYYWNSVDSLLNKGSFNIGLGHLRLASSGINSIPNPHPWMFYHEGISYSLIHNGTINKNKLYNLITENNSDLSWIESHQPQTFDGSDWSLEGWNNVVDSELLLLFIMQQIDFQNNIFTGLQIALSNIINEGTSASQLNLIFSDGSSIYAFGGSNRLFYSESENSFSIMTLPSNNDSLNWTGLNEGELIVIKEDHLTKYPDFILSGTGDLIVPQVANIKMNPVYPNPFNSSINFSFSNILTDASIEISIFNLKGKLVDQFRLNNIKENDVVRWNPTEEIASGTYFIQATLNNIHYNQKILFIK